MKRGAAAPILVNCDIGERGPRHPVDVELMRWIDIANLACGGHAGDAESVRAFLDRAQAEAVTVSAHLSYPDRGNFGRKSLEIADARLLQSLDRQYALLPRIELVKFHGALYNDSCRDAALAGLLADWLRGTPCRTVITAPDSELERACNGAGISVLREAFAERRYQLDPQSGRLFLVSRDRPYATITTTDEAVAQVRSMLEHGEVPAVVELPGGGTECRTAALTPQTVCIHSDSAIALPLAHALREMLGGSRTQ